MSPGTNLDKISPGKKVFGIGAAKTGTTSLGRCFELLGYDHQGQELGLVKDIAKGDLSRIIALAETKQSFEDWPWIILYKELDQAFPGSKFVLTIRDAEKWLGSYKNMLLNLGNASRELNEIRRIIYRLPFPHVSDTQLLNWFEEHNTLVMHYFRERPQDLLVLDWEIAHSWDELCTFLERPVPDVPLPHENKGHYKV